MHEHQGVHVRGDLRVVGEEGRAVALPTGRGVVPVGERERQQRSLGRSLGVAHQQSANSDVEALELAQDAVGTDHPGSNVTVIGTTRGWRSPEIRWSILSMTQSAWASTNRECGMLVIAGCALPELVLGMVKESGRRLRPVLGQ